MGRVIIATAGTSIGQGVERNILQNSLRGGHAVRARLRELRERNPERDAFLRKASAETNGLVSLGVSRDDLVYFLHTDTPDGALCAELVLELSLREFGCDGDVKRIEGMQVEAPTKFRRVGVQKLFEEIARITDGLSADRQVVLNATGGFKSTVAYLTLYGLMHRLRVCYLFEFSHSLLWFPPAPIDFDYQRLGRAADALAELSRQGAMSKDDFFSRIERLQHHERDWFESLLEEDEEGSVTLSVFGSLLDTSLGEQVANVYLMPSAARQLDAMNGVQLQRLNTQLMKLRSRLWRSSHRHAFHGTDLTVWKQGSIPERSAGYEREHQVCICELYADHDRYERDLPGKQRSDYDEREARMWRLPENIEMLVDGESLERSLSEQLRDLQLENEKLVLQWSESDRVRESAVEELRSCSSEVSQLRQQCEDQQREAGAFVEQLEVLREERDQLQQERSLLQQALDQFHSQPWWRALWSRAFGSGR